MKRIATAALALVLTAGLTVTTAGTASAGGMGGGKTTRTQGGGVGCCVDAV